MSLLINTLIEWCRTDDNNSHPNIERVLWIDALSTEVIVIKLFDKRALPIRRSYGEIDQAIAANEIRVLQSDPHTILLRPETEICESHRNRRDKAWELIERLVVNTDKDFLLNSTKRGALISALSRSSGRAKKLIYNYLRRYWQAGG